MKYTYLYQTKTNENREGFIEARDRADAYTKLRKQGIRPYRIIGDDPVRWQPWAIGGTIAALVVALAVAVAVAFGGGDGRAPTSRQQLTGDRSVISTGLANGWEGVFATDLDRYLAAYAQPGWIALPPELDAAALAALADGLNVPLDYRDGDSPEVTLLRNIVAQMRAEMTDYLAAGGTVADDLDCLEERQDQERAFRNRALEALARAPESLRDRAKINLNARLREMGLAEIE